MKWWQWVLFVMYCAVPLVFFFMQNAEVRMSVLKGLDEAVFNARVFVALAALSITSAALLYNAALRNKQDKSGDKLSKLTPKEYRGTVYLFLSFVGFVASLVSFSFFRMLGSGVFEKLCLETLDKLVTCLLLFFGLYFMYAGSGDLLRAIVGGESGLIHNILGERLWKCTVGVFDNALTPFTDWLTRGFFPASPNEKKQINDNSKKDIPKDV